jgi:NADH dehydrogenase
MRNNIIIDAIGPETFTYRELVKTIGQLLGIKRVMIPVSPVLGYLAGQMIGFLTGDVLITKPEIEGLMANLLYTNSPSTAETKLTDWVKDYSESLGKHYASELKRRQGPVHKTLYG